MPSQEDIARIIEEMRSQGLSDDEIRETLEDMGVPAEVINSLVGSGSAESSARAPKEPVASPPVTQSPASSSDDLFADEQHTSSTSVVPASSPPEPEQSEPQKEEPAASPPPKEEFSASIATPPIIEEESVPVEKLDEIHTKVDALHKTLSSDSLKDDIAEIKEMLRELKEDIRDVKTFFSAIQKLLREILDTDRSILLDLYEKSKKR
ncbi:MAG TPA: hypothetical protein EYH14_01055 [Euryarchaeota archaeon]|nr:hypothetical protein [Euryarchaeota archaeon]